MSEIKICKSAAAFLEDVAFERFKNRRFIFTPKFAEDLASECDIESSYWNDESVRKIAYAMEEGFWNPDHSYFPIVFDPFGVCLDGSKRIVACILSRKPVQMNVLVATDKELNNNRDEILARIRHGAR